MVEHWTNAETFAAAEVPLFASSRFVVDNNGASDGAHVGGIKNEHPVSLFPGIH